MKFKKFSPRQNLTMTWWANPDFENYDGIINDGAIRSGKTVSMSLGFIMWSMTHYDGEIFAICGKTIESLRRNVTRYYPEWLSGLFTVRERKTENKLVISGGGHTNTYYLFGGRDESSAALIQGITLAGVLLDEVALMPKSFVEQAMARCSVIGSKFWFNCNPDSPQHWFYTQWIMKRQDKNILYLHFTMADNFSLSEKIKRRYKGLYSGVFYDRYIRGLWVVAEGIIYDGFKQDIHVVPTLPRRYQKYYISCDYGTINPTSIGLWGYFDRKWYRIREYYFDSRKEKYQRTDEEHYKGLAALAGDLHIKAVIVDPSAASFIECIRRHNRFHVIHADNAVLDGIRKVSTHLQAGDILLNDCCKDCIREFGLYRWDDKRKDKDVPLKVDDHTMDDVRYFVQKAFAEDTFSFT